MNNDLILLILTICYTLIIYSDISRKKKLIIVKKKLKKMCVFIDICKRKRLYRTKIQSIYLYIYIYKKYKQSGNDTYQISIGNKQRNVNDLITVFLATRIDIRIFKMLVPSVCLLLVMLAGRAEAHWQVMASGQYLLFFLH